MAAYLKDQFPVLGVSSPERRTLQKPFMTAARTAAPDDVLDVADLCWQADEREFQHVGADLLRARATTLRGRRPRSAAYVHRAQVMVGHRRCACGTSGRHAGEAVSRTRCRHGQYGSTTTTSGSLEPPSFTNFDTRMQSTKPGCFLTLRSGQPIPNSSSARRLVGRCGTTPGWPPMQFETSSTLTRKHSQDSPNAKRSSTCR